MKTILPTLTETQTEQLYGWDYHKGDAYMTSAEAVERKIHYDSPAPEATVCEHCGKTLYHIGIFREGRFDNYKRRMPDTVGSWSRNPQRCECEKSVAAWKTHDDEVKRKEDERRRLEREKQHKQTVSHRLEHSGIKSRFLTRTFENFIRNTPERKTAYQTAMHYAERFSYHLKAGEGLYIEGPCGTGKTHLAAAIALALIELEYRVVLKTADDLFRDIKRTFDVNDGEEYKLLDKYKTCDLLVIDDLGKEQATDWTTAILYAIINERYERQRPVIITTNFNEETLIAVESPRGVGEHRIRAILSRLHETTATLPMVWQDWRKS